MRAPEPGTPEQSDDADAHGCPDEACEPADEVPEYLVERVANWPMPGR
ncbi:hypothetical protein ACGFOU_14085 [Streptomyces sp. NPDC048595]